VIDPRRPERIAICICGASGVLIGFRLAQVLREIGVEPIAILSREALRVSEIECGSSREFVNALERMCRAVYLEDEVDASIASSSNPLDAVVIAPATIRTIGCIVSGSCRGLHIRVAMNALRLRRPVVAVIRESPLGTAELRLLYRASMLGVTIVPAVIAPYTGMKSLLEAIDFVVGKVLDVLGIDHNLYARYSPSRAARSRDLCLYLFSQEGS